MQLRWFLFFLWPVILCSGSLPDPEEEALFLRRISEFWQEGEYQIAKNQIEEFIAEYPQSQFSDPLCSALGDLYLREKNYAQALNYYTRVQSADYADRVFLSRMQCLHQMQWHATLADECESRLKSGKELDPEQTLHATYFLAVALYQQCLNAAKEPEILVKLAQRAQPYFQTLSESRFSGEVAQSFAHLCCVLKDFPKAASIYEDLAKTDASIQEEMLFQAALVQAEYDKELALQSFDALAKMGQKKSKEAAYNRLVLAFDTGRYAELAQAKEAIFAELPEEKTDMARLFFGRSLLSLKKYPEAMDELQTYLANGDPKSESFYAALLSLLEASYQAGDLTVLDSAIEKLTRFFPENPETPKEWPKALFSRAQVLKRNQKLEEARAELEKLVAKFPRFNQRAQTLFELSHIHHQQKGWAASRNWARMFVSEFPHHELAPFAWRYLVTASSEIAAAAADPALKEQLAADIESLLNYKDFFPAAERTEWQFLYAKTLIQLGRYQNAMALLQTLVEPKESAAINPPANAQAGDAWLLLSLCYRDGLKDLDRFCEAAERALAKNATLIAPGQIHIFLFNAYLERSRARPTEPGLLEKGADHLYAAFAEKAPIQAQNLLWLADFFSNRSRGEEPDRAAAEKIAAVLEVLLPSPDSLLKEKGGALEPAVCKLARAYAVLGQLEKEISLLEKIPEKTKEMQLLLGEAFLQKGETEKALAFFDAILASSATVRSHAAAAASLHSARIKMASLDEISSDFAKTASQLKDLVLQKTLANEPSHLEAALEYIDLQTRFEKEPLEKKLSLLLKAKADFERTDDLLSKDYHEARAKLPQKNKIYEGYLLWIDAEILSVQAQLAKEAPLQKELQAKRKDLLLKIIDTKPHPFLAERVRKQLTPDEPKTKT